MNGDGQRRSQGPILITPSTQPGGPSSIRLKKCRLSSHPPSGRCSFFGAMASRSDRRRFSEAMDTLLESGAIITTHNIPDADGLGAARALERWMEIKSPSCKVDIVVSQLISNTAKLISYLGMTTKDWQAIPPSDKRPIIIVDTNSMALLTDARILGNAVHLVIDHHQHDECSPESKYSITNIRSVSACEIIASLIPAVDFDTEERIYGNDSVMARALACGLIGDTDRLLLADIHSLHIIERLLKRAKVMRYDIDNTVFPPLDPNIVSALLEEMRFVQKTIRHDRVIAIAPTRIEPSAILSTKLLGVGAHVVAALGEISDSVHKMSLRVNVKDAHERGLHAHVIAREIGARCGVSERLKPGGHIDKAGGTLTGRYEDLSRIILDTIIEKMDEVFGKY